MDNKKAIQLLLLAAICISLSHAKGLNKGLQDDQRPSTRLKRQNSDQDGLPPSGPETEESGSGEPEEAGKKGGVSLGKILGLVFLTCCIIYCIGISWKVYNVCKGTYVEEEPVFLKYK